MHPLHPIVRPVWWLSRQLLRSRLPGAHPLSALTGRQDLWHALKPSCVCPTKDPAMCVNTVTTLLNSAPNLVAIGRCRSPSGPHSLDRCCVGFDV